MESTYSLVGIPEGLAIALALVCLSLALTPWIGGAELGPLKIPNLKPKARQSLRIAGPLLFISSLVGFAKCWSPEAQETIAPSYSEYVESFFDTSKPEYIHGKPFVLNELETRELERFFGKSTWEGGPHWGKVTFDESGRFATFTNSPGRSQGKILIQGAPLGTVPLILGEWSQGDGQKGRLLLTFPAGPRVGIMEVLWGPGLNAKSVWSANIQ